MKQLDIEKIYELYEKNDDESLHTIASEIETCYDSGESYLQELAETWDENVHFYEGDQHIYYVEESGRYETIPITKYNKFIPRPVTNYLYPIVNTITSVLTRNKPAYKVWENSDSSIDVNRAKMADTVLDTKWEIDNEQLNHILAAKMAIVCGTVFRKDYWDISGSQTVEVDGKKYPLGDNRVDILSPFEVIPDLSNRGDIDDGNYVLESSVHTLEWIKNNYDRKGKGYTGKAKDVKENKKLLGLIGYSERLKGSTGRNSGDGNEMSLKNSCVVYEAHLRPTAKHTQGLVIVVADGKVLYAGDSKYVYLDGRLWHPYSCFRYERHPFRFHGISLLENIVPIQRKINSIDALVILNRMTMASPQWLLPIGCGVKQGYNNGQPALNIWYRAVNGASPMKVPGVPLDASVYKEREKAVEELYRVAMSNEVLSGLRPVGVNTAFALQILLEQSNAIFNPVTQDWEKFIEKGQLKKINVIRTGYREPRPEFIQKMKSMSRDTTEVEISDFFTGGDLGDNVDLRVEPNSSVPRMKALEQQTLMQLAGSGALGPIDPIQNPAGNAEILRKFGIVNFPTASEPDYDRAKWENDMMRQSQDVFVIESDKHEIHLQVIDDEMKKPEFFSRNDEEVINRYMNHRQEHMMAMQAKQPAQPPGMAGQPPPVAMEGQQPLPPPMGQAGGPDMMQPM